MIFFGKIRYLTGYRLKDASAYATNTSMWSPAAVSPEASLIGK